MRADILNELSTLGKKVDASTTHLLFLDNAKHPFFTLRAALPWWIGQVLPDDFSKCPPLYCFFTVNGDNLQFFPTTVQEGAKTMLKAILFDVLGHCIRSYRLGVIKAKFGKFVSTFAKFLAIEYLCPLFPHKITV